MIDYTYIFLKTVLKRSTYVHHKVLFCLFSKIEIPCNVSRFIIGKK